MPLDQNKLNDLFGDDWGSELEGDLNMDDSGELAFRENSEESEDSNDLNNDESDESDAEESEDESEASDGDETDSADSDADPVESRFQSLESSVDKLIGLVEDMAKQKNAKSIEPEQDTDDDDDDVPLTKKELRKMMEETVSKAVKPLNQQSAEQKEAAVIQQLFKEFGEDVVRTNAPYMKTLLESNPSLGVQGAWDLVSKIKGIKKPVAAKATKQDSGNKKELPKAKGDAAKLREKAENLKTAKGVSGSGKDKKRAVGLDDIVKSSWDEVFESGG